MKRSTTYYIKYTLVGLVILLILALLLLQVPYVQTRLVNTVNHRLEQKLGNKISVESVNINFFNKVVLQNVYIEDQNQDTLAMISQLQAKVSLLDLLQNELHVKSIELDNAHVHLKKDEQTGQFNYQFLLDQFASQDDSTSDKSAFNLDIDAIHLENMHFIFEDPSLETRVKAHMKRSKIDIDEFDLNKRKIKIADLSLTEAEVHYAYGKDQDKASTELRFPGLPIQLEVLHLDLSKVKLGIQQNGSTTKPGNISFDKLLLDDMVLKAENIILDSTSISGQIDQLSLKEQSGFDLDHLATNFTLNNTGIELSKLVLRTENSKLTNSTTIEFSDFSKLKNIDQLNLSTTFVDTEISVTDINYFTPILSKDFFSNINLSEKIILNGKAEGNAKNLNLKAFTARIPGVLSTKLNGNIKNLQDKNALSLQVNIEELKTSATKLSKILPNGMLPTELQMLGDIELKGRFNGTAKELLVTDFILNSSAHTSAQLSGTIQNMLDPQNLSMNIDIKELYTHIVDIQGLVKGELPIAIKDAGPISYTGNFDGTLQDFKLDGTLITDIGEAKTNIDLDFNSNYTDASYAGTVVLDKFNLGSVLNNSDFGLVSLNLKTSGTGFDLNTINNELEAHINSLSYKDIVYENFNFNGQIAEKKINGNFDIDNKNAVAQFQGMLDLSEDQARMDFLLNVDTLELQPMNLTSQDIGFSGKTQVIGSGKSIDDFIGSILIRNFNLRKDSLAYHSDSLVVNSLLESKSEKQITVLADGIDAKLSGDFNISQLPIYVQNLVDEYIPVEWIKAQRSQDGKALDDPQIFNTALYVEDEKLIRLFLPQLESLDNLQLSGSVNSKTDSLYLEGHIEQFTFDGIQSTNIDISTKAEENKIKNQITFKNLSGIANLLLPSSRLNATLQKDSLLMSLDVQNDSLANILQLSAALTKEEDLYEINLSKQFQLDSATWTIAEDNHIKFKDNYLDIQSLYISKGTQSIDIQSVLEGPIGNTPIAIAVRNFDIHELSNLLDLENDAIYGDASGDILLADIFDKPHYSGDLVIKNMLIKEEEIGDLQITAAKRDAGQIVDIDIALSGTDNKFEGTGYLDIETKEIRFDADFDHVDLAILDPFLIGIISQSEGTLGGKVALNGSLNRPIINGIINTNTLNTLIDFSQARYAINQQSIAINDSKIAFEDLILTDINGKTAKVNGKIEHNRFKDFYYDLTIDSKEFQFLNTTVEDNPLFYGSLYLEANAKVTGPLKLPNLEVNAKALKNSEFNLSPFIESDFISQDDYIIFTNKDYREIDSTVINLYDIKNDLPLNLILNLDLDEATVFRFIVDPVSGDYLSCNGNSNLQIKIAPSGQIDVFGSYVVTKGKYAYSYANAFRKEFNLVPGGRVNFQGDPLLANFDINAIYQTRATPFDLLIDNSTLSDAEIIATKKKVATDVVMNIAGSISDLDLTFDLQFPNEEFNAVNAVSGRLQEIRNDQEEMYNQVFGLLLLDSFIASNSSNIDINTGSDIALKSISNLIESRLNNLAKKYIKGVDLILIVESYNNQHLSEGENTSVTELGVGLSKSIFNDRVKVTALGNIDVDNRNDSAEFTGIAGDFIIEYKLNARGTYTINAFRKSDYDILQDENANKNGIGIATKKNLYLKRKRKKNGK